MVPVVAAALVLALLACTEVAAEGPTTICDTVSCGKGTCMETPGFLPPFTTSFNCTCDPGATQLLGIPFAPCTSPECHFDASCFNLSLGLPRGIPVTDPCVAINCGPGECKKGDGLFSYSCECQPGYVNFLNLTAFPCVKKCVFGVDCSTAPPPPSTAPPPGSVPSWRLLQLLLLLLSLGMVQLV